MMRGMRVSGVCLIVAVVFLANVAVGQVISSGRGGKGPVGRVGGGSFSVLTGRSNEGTIGLAAIRCVQEEIELEGEGAERARKIADAFDEERRAELEKIGLVVLHFAISPHFRGGA